MSALRSTHDPSLDYRLALWDSLWERLLAPLPDEKGNEADIGPQSGEDGCAAGGRIPTARIDGDGNGNLSDGGAAPCQS